VIAVVTLVLVVIAFVVIGLFLLDSFHQVFGGGRGD
jgi:hypothetical protein